MFKKKKIKNKKFIQNSNSSMYTGIYYRQTKRTSAFYLIIYFLYLIIFYIIKKWLEMSYIYKYYLYIYNNKIRKDKITSDKFFLTVIIFISARMYYNTK